MTYLTRTILLAVCLTVLLMMISVVTSYGQTSKENNDSPCRNNSNSTAKSRRKSSKAVEKIDEYLDGRFMEWKRDKPFLFSTSKYDRKGRLVESNNYRSDGVPMAISLSVYDGNDRLIRSNILSAVNQKPYLETRYLYNEDGTLKERTGVSLDDNTILSKTVYKYDSQKNYLETIESKWYTNALYRYGHTMKPDKCGNSEAFYYDREGKMASRDVYSDDDQGNMVFLVRYTAEGKLLGKFKYEYEFDNQGRWTKKSDFEWKEENGKPQWKLIDVKYHKIKYFDTK